MATNYLKAALASSTSLLRLRGPVILRSHRVLLPLSFRYASTSFAPKLAPREEAGATQHTRSTFRVDRDVEVKEHTDGVHAISSDQPEFISLKERVSSNTLKAITAHPMGLKHMSAVQAAVLPLLPDLVKPSNADNTESESQQPRDLLVKAKTGTGKTLAFLVPAIEHRLKQIEEHVNATALDSQSARRVERNFARDHAGVMIISPTRELATQIANEALKLSTHQNDFQVRLLVGGVSKGLQMREWRKGRKDIVVGTPGRLRDLLENEPEVRDVLSKAKLLILDEADTLLEMGFREEIEAITTFLPPTPERQTFLFSATVSKAIQQVARATLDKNHSFINCVSDDASPVHAHVPQYHTVLPSANQQIPHVLRLLAHDQLVNQGKSKTIIFCPTTKMTQLFATFIKELSKTCLPALRDTNVYEIHSKCTQQSRTRTSDRFRKDRSGASILVSSDVSARGVDYPGVTRVIQIGIPGGSDEYIHRVGRTGRGNEGYGRADLVLLPWEAGFVRWQLAEIPLKPLSVGELNKQVEELGQQAPPQGVEALQGIDTKVSDLIKHLDEEAVKETMASLVGYYLGKSAEMRADKRDIVEGLKSWTVEGCGLERPPYISSALLAKMGYSDKSRSPRQSRPTSRGSFGVRSNGDRSESSWPQRGPPYRSRSEDRSESSWPQRGASQRSEDRGEPHWLQRGASRRPRSEDRFGDDRRGRRFRDQDN